MTELSYNEKTKMLEVVPPWGEIGYVTFKRTYSRKLSDKSEQTEEYHDSILRVIKALKTQLKCGFTEEEESRLYEYFMGLKGSVAGRFLWQLGTRTVNTFGMASLQNCAGTVVDEPIRPFTWTMDMLK